MSLLESSGAFLAKRVCTDMPQNK